MTRDPGAPAIAWLRTNAAADDTLLAAPYLLMQWRGPFVNMDELRSVHMLPEHDWLEEKGVDWVVVDEREWRGYLARRPMADATKAFDACCTLEFEVPAGPSIYRVK